MCVVMPSFPCFFTAKWRQTNHAFPLADCPLAAGANRWPPTPQTIASSHVTRLITVTIWDVTQWLLHYVLHHVLHIVFPATTQLLPRKGCCAV